MVLIKYDKAMFIKKLNHIIHQIKELNQSFISKIKWMKRDQYRQYTIAIKPSKK